MSSLRLCPYCQFHLGPEENQNNYCFHCYGTWHPNKHAYDHISRPNRTTIEDKILSTERRIIRIQSEVSQILSVGMEDPNWEKFHYALWFSELKTGKQNKERQRVDDKLREKACNKTLFYSDAELWQPAIHRLENMRVEIQKKQSLLTELAQYDSVENFLLSSESEKQNRKSLTKAIKAHSNHYVQNLGYMAFRDKLTYDIFVQQHFDCGNCTACQEVRNNNHWVYY